MHFEFIRGGQVPPRKTANLSSPARDRLVPLRDLANLFGCTEREITQWAKCSSMDLESLEWRGSNLNCLTLHDAFRLHLGMRSMAEGPTESMDLRSNELRMALREKDRELKRVRGRAKSLEQRVELRDGQLGELMEGVGDLERTVAGRAGVRRELASVQKLFVQAQVEQSSLIIKLSQAEQSAKRAQRILGETQALFHASQDQLAQAKAAQEATNARLQAMERQAQRMKGIEAERQKAADARAAQARAALLQIQPKLDWLEDRRLARLRTSQRMWALKRTCATSMAVERNLERYSNRLEQRLRNRGN